MLSPRFSFSVDDDAAFDPRSEGGHEASFRRMRKSHSNITREEAVGRYRRDLPEYAYELSFRDLVELPAMVSSMQKARERGRDSFSGFWIGEEKTKARKSAELGGFFRRVFFPLPASGRKKSSSRTSRSCSTISSTSLSIDGDGYSRTSSRDNSK